MPVFNYQGRNAGRQLVEGSCESSSLESAITQLISQGITIVNIVQEQQKTGLKQLLTMRLGKESVKLPELLIFCRQMHTLTKSGISMVVALRRLAEISRNQTFTDTLRGIERGILAGQPLATCLQRYPDVFPSLLVELVQVGEETGGLDESFLQISGYLALEYETRKRVKAAFRYPTFVILTVIIAIIVLNLFVIPNFAKLYSSFHSQLPGPTRALLGFSAFMRAQWLPIFAGAGILYLMWRRYVKTPKGKFFWHRLQLRLPIVGGIIERVMLSRFTRTLGIIFRAGIPLNRGIVLVSGAVGNEYARQCILLMQQSIEHGESLSSAAANSKLLTPLVLQMLTVGEETGALDNMLYEVAGFYEREVDYDLETLGEKIEPLLLLIVAGMVLLLAIAVFLPMWDIYKFAQGSH